MNYVPLITNSNYRPETRISSDSPDESNPPPMISVRLHVTSDATRVEVKRLGSNLSEYLTEQLVKFGNNVTDREMTTC